MAEGRTIYGKIPDQVQNQFAQNWSKQETNNPNSTRVRQAMQFVNTFPYSLIIYVWFHFITLCENRVTASNFCDKHMVGVQWEHVEDTVDNMKVNLFMISYLLKVIIITLILFQIILEINSSIKNEELQTSGNVANVLHENIQV